MNFFFKYIISLSLCVLYVHAETLTSQNAVITEVLDGDTFDVRIEGENEDTRIRFIGLNTTEVNLQGSLNDCYADEATQRLIELTGGEGASVVLKALHPSFRDQYGRAWRHIFVEKNGIEKNIVKTMLEEGLAVPLALSTEGTYDENYAKIGQRVKAQKIGIWSTENHCPTDADSENVRFKMLVHYDAKGDDNTNLNDEWVKIENITSRSIDISHWWLRDSALNFFRFPESIMLDAGKEVIVHSGKGTSHDNVFFWGSNEPIFSNVYDAAYLLDYLDYDTEDTQTTYSAKGNIKASFLYPCLYNCTDGLQNKIKIVANYDAVGDDDTNINGEWIRITNTSNGKINLKDYLLHYDVLGSTAYAFRADTVLNSGEELYLYVGEGADTRLHKYIGEKSSILANNSGKVWITTFDNIEIDGFSWPANQNKKDTLKNKIDIQVNYDALGDDSTHPNGEWVSIVNTSGVDINLKDYLLHYDAKGSQHYFFENSTVVHPSEALYLYMGEGNETRLKKYVGRTSGILANSGGRAWLTTLDGVLIHSFAWPCSEGCHYDAPLEIVDVHYDADGNDATNPNGEWITIKNTSGTIINLRNWKLKVRDYHFNFTQSKILNPNNQIKVYMGGGDNGYYWGFSEGKLNNSGDVVKFFNPQRILSHCVSWGSKSNECKNLLDSDNDGILNSEDLDDDGDNVLDKEDRFPLSSQESIDTDKDGIGNNTDKDDDGDEVSDLDEILAGTDPLNPLDFKSRPTLLIPVLIYLLDS